MSNSHKFKRFQCSCSEKGYGKSGNRCNVSEEPWSSAVESCNCANLTSPDCQLQLLQDKIICKQNVSSSCLLAVKNWANSYSTASNANFPECRYQDPNFKASQETWRSCASGALLKYLKIFLHTKEIDYYLCSIVSSLNFV